MNIATLFLSLALSPGAGEHVSFPHPHLPWMLLFSSLRHALPGGIFCTLTSCLVQCQTLGKTAVNWTQDPPGQELPVWRQLPHAGSALNSRAGRRYLDLPWGIREGFPEEVAGAEVSQAGNGSEGVKAGKSIECLVTCPGFMS